MTSPVSLTGAATQGVSQRQHFGRRVSCWRFSEAEFPLDARVTLSSPGLPRDHTRKCTIVLQVFLPQARDTAQQKRKRCVDSDQRRSDYQKEEKIVLQLYQKGIMSLRLNVKVILSPQARNMYIAQDSTQSRISKHTFRVGTHGQLRKKPHHVLDSTYRIGIELEISLIAIRMIQYHCTDSSM